MFKTLIVTVLASFGLGSIMGIVGPALGIGHTLNVLLAGLGGVVLASTYTIPALTAAFNSGSFKSIVSGSNNTKVG